MLSISKKQSSSSSYHRLLLIRLSCCFQVVFVKKLEAFHSLPYQQFHCEKKYDIYFVDEKIYAQYRY